MSVEELRAYGLEQMGDDEIRGFLSSQGLGVLGLPTEGAPYLFPLSYDYDGEDCLYFTYLVGEGSRKRRLSERTETASFLVFSADSMFNWESVLLTGRLRQRRPEEPEGPREGSQRAWRPDLFRRADLSGGIEVFVLDIEERSGIRHTGLPPGMEPRAAEPTDER